MDLIGFLLKLIQYPFDSFVLSCKMGLIDHSYFLDEFFVIT